MDAAGRAVGEVVKLRSPLLSTECLMAPRGVEPLRADSKSAALPLSYGARVQSARRSLGFLARSWWCGAGGDSATRHGPGERRAARSVRRRRRRQPARDARGWRTGLEPATTGTTTRGSTN